MRNETTTHALAERMIMARHRAEDHEFSDAQLDKVWEEMEELEDKDPEDPEDD
jgi:ribosome assembly protein YihI (activator of Der GTPase)